VGHDSGLHPATQVKKVITKKQLFINFIPRTWKGRLTICWGLFMQIMVKIFSMPATFLGWLRHWLSRERLLGRGYLETALANDTYIVSFSGNGFTSEGSVQSNLLRRCADPTPSKGYWYFIVALVGLFLLLWAMTKVESQ
jgi:hypothetical protein